MSLPRVARAAVAAAALGVVSLAAGRASAVNSCGGQTHENDCGSANNYVCCAVGNCTWWAWEAACRHWHNALPIWGYAYAWGHGATVDPRYDVLGSPVVGSIATAGKIGAYSGTGHVAWVIGVSGGTITVEEEGCGFGALRTRAHPASWFNTGFVVLHGSECGCNDGDKQTEDCSCGTKTRTCHSCSWGEWSACAGPKEVCDGVDNDCNGLVDDGHPQDFGPTRPDYAATLVDVSYPPALRSGEQAMVWADFRNDGKKAWEKGGLWLGSKTTMEGHSSSMLATETWPAWNVPAVLEEDVAPGEVGRFSFDVTGPDQAGMTIDETFQLEVPGGAFLACPSPDLSPSIQVMPALDRAGGAGGAGGGGGSGGSAPVHDDVKASAKCSVTSATAGEGGGLGLLAFAAMAAVGLSRRRRA